MSRWIYPISLLLVCAFSCMAYAQQPFNTDDIGVTDYHKFHMEFANEFDWLRSQNLPNLRQDTANLKFAFGAWHHVEVGLDEQLLAISTQPTGFLPRTAFGYGDVDFSVKYNFLQEGKRWFQPAMAGSLAIEFPTGDETKQLGSGLRDYTINLIMQKTLTEKIQLHLNGGYVLAGNTLTGVIGVRTTGSVYTGGASVTRDFTPRLRLGVELTGALTSNFDLGRGQLQTQVGGNYQVRKNMTFDFGLTSGFYASSPRIGPQIGLSYDF
jgi:hypothetical protein